MRPLLTAYSSYYYGGVWDLGQEGEWLKYI
jgi:hypothetical protein